MKPVMEKSAKPRKTAARPASGATSPPPAAAAPRASTPPKPLSEDQRAKLEQVSKGLEMLQEDTSVPRNIRRGAEEARKILWDDALALDVRKSGAISILDELANDPNIPIYGRTLIWSIMSQLEPIQ